MKKKKFKFGVSFGLTELSNVCLASGVLFSKLKVLDGGKFSKTSRRVEVSNNRVKWEETFEFGCKMTANATTGVLDSCFGRISVRKETKGGKSYEKLGFVDVNLADFAGSNNRTKKYLLEGDDDKANRQDNSILEVKISMKLIQGDPLFKLPCSLQTQLTVESPNSKGLTSAGEDNRGLLSYLDEACAGTATPETVTPDTPISPCSETLDGEEDTVAKLDLAEGFTGRTRKGLGHHRSASEPPFLKGVNQSGQLSEGYGSMTTQSTSSCSDAGRRFNSIERAASKYRGSRVDAENIVDQIINSQESEEPQGHIEDANRNDTNLMSFLMAKKSTGDLLPSDFGLVVDDKYRTL